MHVLLTGATGYVGRHLLARLLGDGHRVSVLVRPRRGQLQMRVIETLRPLPLPITVARLPEIQVIAGDVARPDCGLAADDRAMLATTRPDAIVHAAGLTRFEAHLADDLLRHNRGGTAAVHALARELGIAHLVHLSTAFVAGTCDASFGPDDLERGQGFNNPYERSKFAAERDLHAAADDGPAISVVRPSIVVGGCPLGETDSVSTVYTFIKALHFLRECARRDHARGRLGRQGIHLRGQGAHIPLTLAAAAGLTLDLVHVDDVVDAVMAELAMPPVSWRVRQVTGPGTAVTALRDGICAALDVTGPRLVPHATLAQAPRSRIEQQFDRITRVYQPYLQRSPTFVRPPKHRPRAIDVERCARDFLAQLSDRAGNGAGAGIGALALAVAGIQSPADYFRALVEGEVGRHFLSRHDFVDVRVCFRLAGEGGGDTTVHFSRGRASLVDPASPFAADCTYSLDGELFMRIIAGQADLRAAFFAGRVRIAGDKELALKFGALLGLYYHRIEEHVIDEVAV